MELKLEREGGTLIAVPVGRLDGENAAEAERKLQSEIGDGSLLIDFSQLDYISSAGLRVVLVVAKTLKKKGRHLDLCSLSDSIMEVFSISGFDQIEQIKIHKDRATALAAG